MIDLLLANFQYDLSLIEEKPRILAMVTKLEILRDSKRVILLL